MADAYGIEIGTVGSHGKARIVSYGRGYPIVTGIIKGFSKSTWHYDTNTVLVENFDGEEVEQVIGLVDAPYPLSPEELSVEQAEQEADDFQSNLMTTVMALKSEVATLKDDKAALEGEITTMKGQITGLEGSKT